MNITEKILAKHAEREKVEPGEVLERVSIDTLMMHDVTTDLEVEILERYFGNKIADGLKIVVTPDHYVPAKDIESAGMAKRLDEFVREHPEADISYYPLAGGDYGVCHVMLPEKGHVLPGQVIVGGDSHTCTYGSLGAFATGIGSTEGGNVLATGDLWFKVPETMKIEVNGKMPRNTMAKDLFLRVVGDIGVDGALYQAMEWTGKTIRELGMRERMTLTNMAIEAGAKSGIIEPDDQTLSYLWDVGWKNGFGSRTDFERLYGELRSDPDAQYDSIRKVKAEGLEPLVACPDLPSNVKPASELQDVKIDQAYIGGCTGGKYTDFQAAAEVLKGNKTAKGVRLLIVPSTADIQRKIVNEGLYNIFMDAGAVFSAPTCGACLGGYMGILAEGETCISTTNRNFRGRMGHPESKVYLASPKTVAASAIAGHIVGAEK